MRVEILTLGPDASIRCLDTTHEQLFLRLGSGMHLGSEPVVDQRR